MLFAHLFSTYAPRVSAVAIPVAYLLNEALYFSTLYLPTEAIMALRPAGKLLGVVLLGLCLRRKERLPLADNEYPLQYGISIKSAGERAITLFATHRSWALIIAGSTLFPLIFGFVAQACSRLSTNSGLYDGFNEIVALGTIALLVFYGRLARRTPHLRRVAVLLGAPVRHGVPAATGLLAGGRPPMPACS